MRIAISALQPDLDGEMDPRFGRCPYFVIVDTETMETETFANQNAGASSGAGIRAAQAVVGKGVDAVVTGRVGPNAHEVLTAAGVAMYTGVSGKIRDALAMFKAGRLQSAAGAGGRTPSRGGGGGMGVGRGRGMGMGRGMGLGGGRMQSFGPVFHPAPGEEPSQPPGTPPPQSREEEIRLLKRKARALAEEMANINRRIQEMEDRSGR